MKTTKLENINLIELFSFVYELDYKYSLDFISQGIKPFDYRAFVAFVCNFIMNNPDLLSDILRKYNLEKEICYISSDILRVIEFFISSGTLRMEIIRMYIVSLKQDDPIDPYLYKCYKDTHYYNNPSAELTNAGYQKIIEERYNRAFLSLMENKPVSLSSEQIKRIPLEWNTNQVVTRCVSLKYIINDYIKSFNKVTTLNVEDIGELKFFGDGVKKQTIVLVGKDSCIVSDKGKRLSNQDSAIIMNHPKVSEFKLIAVADGMGGMASGEKFSAKVIDKLREWFFNFSVTEDIYNNDEYYIVVYNALKECINNINNELALEFKGVNGGTTLALAIVCGKHTILLNIGDSRIYNYTVNGLNLLTEDQSYVWNDKINVDTLRFHKYSNAIWNYLPKDVRAEDRYTHIETDKLGYLVLCTDGVSDMMEMSTFRNLLEQNTHSVKGAASGLVKYAVSYDSYLLEENEVDLCLYNDVLSAGKDNATVAIQRVNTKRLIRG